LPPVIILPLWRLTASGGPRSSAPVPAATLTRIRASVRAALNVAIRRGLLTENRAAKAELPRARRPR